MSLLKNACFFIFLLFCVVKAEELNIESLGPFNCGIESDDDGKSRYVCKMCGLNPGDAIVDLVKDTIPDLHVDLDFSELIAGDISSTYNVPVPNECCSCLPCWSGLCNLCVHDVSPSSIPIPVPLKDALSIIPNLNVDLKTGFVAQAVEQLFKIADFLPDICVEIAFNLCSFELELQVRWSSVSLYRKNMAVLPPPYDKYSPESLYKLLNPGGSCFSKGISAFGSIAEIPPDPREFTLRDGQSLRACLPIMGNLFKNQLICIDLGNLTLSETGVSFCPRGFFQDALNGAAGQDYECFEFGNADKCSRHSDCSTCIEDSECGWCPTKNSCRGNQLINYFTDPCGGCPGDLVGVCAADDGENTQHDFFGECGLDFAVYDKNQDTYLSRTEYSQSVGKWIVSAEIERRAFDFMDINFDDHISLNEYCFKVDPLKYPLSGEVDARKKRAAPKMEFRHPTTGALMR